MLAGRRCSQVGDHGHQEILGFRRIADVKIYRCQFLCQIELTQCPLRYIGRHHRRRQDTGADAVECHADNPGY